MTMQFMELYQKLGYVFKNKNLLKAALTHRSADSANNERLEFLGDALINFLTAEKLYQEYTEANEGELTRLRAALVKGETLAYLAKELKIDEYVVLGPGEIKTGGAERQSTLATTMEAVIGAIYLDGGLQACRERVLAWLAARIDAIPQVGVQKDPKTLLQEYLQGRRLPLPSYAISKIEGKAHTQIFHVECRVEGLPYQTQGHGASRRKAEQDAAQKFINLL